MRFQLSLSQKGLLLVGSLLALEMLFVGVLAQMVSEAEREAATEAHSKAIVGHTNRIFELTYDAGNAVAAYQSDRGGTPAAQRYYASSGKLPAEIAALRKLVENDPIDFPIVERVDRDLAKLIKLTSMAIDTAEAGDRVQAAYIVAETKPIYTKTKDEMFADMHQLMHHQEKIIAQSPAAQARSRQNQQKVLLAGFIFNVIAAIAVAVFFLRGITDRLGVLTHNTDRLARGAPLAPRLPGGDEIAKLDHVFHDMADALNEAARLKQEFVAMISHDLRTPLTSIHGFLCLLEDGVYGEVPAVAKERTNLAVRNIDRLIRLINDLLDIEKMEAGQLDMNLSATPLSNVVSRSVESLRNFAEGNDVRLEVEGDSQLTIHGDEGRLIQVLVNLVSNAVKYSPKDGVVVVASAEADGYAVVRVIDQGPGIPAEYLEAVFERFKQVPDSEERPQKGGTGLGLAISKKIIDQHGGEIGVESTVGKGSTFWFKVPLEARMVPVL